MSSLKAIIKKGGKGELEEMKVNENIEELKAKDYASALERMQNALKREKQIKILKDMNEKSKMSNVSQFQNSTTQKKDFNFQLIFDLTFLE